MQFKSESDRSLTRIALRSAAERWTEWITTLCDPSVIESFRQQAADARRIADQIEDDE